MLFVVKTVVAGLIIAFTSGLASNRPVLAGFIIALPITSMISILFSYAEFRNMERINQFATAIFIAVPLSLIFFLPFLLNRWVKMNFPISFILGIVLVGLVYVIYAYLSKTS